MDDLGEVGAGSPAMFDRLVVVVSGSVERDVYYV